MFINDISFQWWEVCSRFPTARLQGDMIMDAYPHHCLPVQRFLTFWMVVE